jgi:integrase
MTGRRRANGPPPATRNMASPRVHRTCAAGVVLAAVPVLLDARSKGAVMARQPTGQLYENRSKLTGKVTSYGVRFRYGGKRRYVSLEATNRRDAEVAMADLMADVRRGLWIPPEDRAPEPQERKTPTFAEFASEWFRGLCDEGGRNGDGIGQRSQSNILWRLGHLRSFGPMRLDVITVEDVDRWRRAKVKEGTLSASSINRMLETLTAILDQALEYDYLAKNVAKGKRRRLKTSRPRRPYLDSAEQIEALLDAAWELDGGKLRRTLPWRRAMLAVMTLGGLRIDECLSLRWRHVDLAAGRIHVAGSKTDAADRIVHMLPLLRDCLLTYAAARPDRDPDGLVFATTRAGRNPGGKKHSPTNIRRRVLVSAIEKANEALRRAGKTEIAGDLTPHGLRRTFASILVALGRDPAVVMRQMGHTTPAMTLGVYAAAMDWADGERERLRALVEGAKGQETGNTAPETLEPEAAAVSA